MFIKPSTIKSMKLYRFVWVGLCLFSYAFAQQADTRRINFIEYDLDNGLHVILHEDHSSPVVAVSVLYHVGSKNEDPERTGFAHFFEHLMFEGTENIDRGQYFKIIEGSGGTLNASTSFDRTYYYEVLPSNKLELGLWMEAERMLHAVIDSVGVETQRNVVKEERSQRYDNQPYGSVIEETMKRAFTKHPYNWTPIGSVQYIDQATLDEFMEFYEIFYVPNNATLTVAGDLDVEQTKEWIEKYFDRIPKSEREIPRPDIVEPPLGGEVRDTIYDNIQLPAIFQAYRIPEQGSEDYYALSMLSTLMAGGESSRLNKSLVDKQQLAVAAQTIPLPTEDPGLAIVLAIANVGIDLENLETAIDEEISQVMNELISEREFQKIRNQMESNFVQSNASMAGIAQSLANYHVYYGDANLINTEIDRFMRVTKEGIQRVAQEYLVKNNRVVLHYLPKSMQPGNEGK